jgi:hypothetical protein
MNRYIILFLLFSPLFLQAQVFDYKIEGTILNPENNKFAYLVIDSLPDLERQRYVSPIVANKFTFKGKTDLNGWLFRTGMIYLGEDSMRSEQSVSESMLMRRVVGRGLVIENLTIDIDKEGNINEAKVEGTELNRDHFALKRSVKTGKIDEFIKSHLDSPLSAYYLKILLKLESKMMIEYSGAENLFNMLSMRIKNSKEGRLLAAEIEKTK